VPWRSWCRIWIGDDGADEGVVVVVTEAAGDLSMAGFAALGVTGAKCVVVVVVIVVVSGGGSSCPLCNDNRALERVLWILRRQRYDAS
jgi:hypothetical protein